MVCHMQLRLFSISFFLNKLERFMTFIHIDNLLMYFKLKQFVLCNSVALPLFLFECSPLNKSVHGLSCARMIALPGFIFDTVP